MENRLGIMQTRLELAAEKCMRDLEDISIPYSKPVTFKVNTRAKMRWGQTKLTWKGFEININSSLLDGKHAEGLRNTIIHELLHTCPGAMNHGKVWKSLAEKVGMHFGDEIKRTSSAEEKGFSKEDYEKERPTRKVKYRFRCTKCGEVIDRTRESQFTRNYTSYRHTGCYGSFQKIVL